MEHKINQVQAGMVNVRIMGRITAVERKENFYKYVLEDGSGKIFLITNEELRIGSRILIERGHVYRFRGELTITKMRKGRIRTIE